MRELNVVAQRFPSLKLFVVFINACGVFVCSLSVEKRLVVVVSLVLYGVDRSVSVTPG